MVSGTGRVTAVLSLLASITKAIDVNVTGEWKPSLGWLVTCSWETLPNDTLQSVRLYNNDQQFMIYRPETHGHGRSEVFEAADMVMRVDCAITTYRGQEGSCTLLLEPYKPHITSYTYSCEVSGERPLFRIERKDYAFRIFVPPSDAIITSNKLENSSPNRVTLNCSSTGIPAPHLKWTVAKDKHQADFSDRFWDSSLKLWHSWSQLSFTRNDDVKVLCSPEVTSNIGIVKGKHAEYNTASRLWGPAKLTLTVLLLNLLR